jgi:hypothetical protein
MYAVGAVAMTSWEGHGKRQQSFHAPKDDRRNCERNAIMIVRRVICSQGIFGS